MPSFFSEAMSAVDESVKGLLTFAYDADRFKQYAKEILAEKHFDTEAAANEIIWQATSKVTTEGALSGFLSSISLGIYGLVALPADIVFQMYHMIEMCGALAEIHGLDTNDDYVKTFVLAGAASDRGLRSKAGQAVGMYRGMHRVMTEEFVRLVVVPVLKALGLRMGFKAVEIVPVIGAFMGAGFSFWIMDESGHGFIDEIKKMKV